MNLTKYVLLVLMLIVSFNLFGQELELEYSIPEGYEAQIDEKDYRYLVNKSIKVISKIYKISSVKEGVIELEKGQDYSVINLHNLISKCSGVNKRHWNGIIKSHFEIMSETMNAQKKLDLSQYEKIKDYLSIRIYGEHFVIQNGGIENIVSRTDLEGTRSLLMLDLPNTFSVVPREVFELWSKPLSEVFQVAQKNVNKQECVKLTEQIIIDEVPIEISFIENEDYGASLLLDLESNAPDLIGEWGSVVAVPNKGIVNLIKVTPDKPLDFMLFIQKFQPVVEQFYVQHPQPVSADFHWYYKGEFTKINIQETDEGMQVTAPKKLSELLGRE